MQSEAPKGSGVGQGMDRRTGDPRLRWYPQSWRTRYGDEFIALLDEEYGAQIPTAARLRLVMGGLRERARQSGLVGDSLPAADRLRAGALMVFVAWTAFVIAGASLAKLAEHFDEALPHDAGVHHVPDLAFALLQTVAGLAGVCVVAGSLLAAPAFVRFLKAGGWASVRGHVLRALACTVFTGASTVAVLVWARHLTAEQPMGLHWYGAAFLMWAALIVLSLMSWTVVAVAAARRVEFTRAILTAEAALAVAITGAMVVMVGATAVWCLSMARVAPAFLAASPGGAAGSRWDVWLAATVSLMVVAMGTAAVGAFREVRVWAEMRSG
jgi:hypothetical protein